MFAIAIPVILLVIGWIMKTSTRDDTTVHFVALLPYNYYFQNGGDVIYSYVITDGGGGYNGPTEIFTAPVKGYYLFSVSVAAGQGKFLYLDLRTGSGQVLARLEAYYKDRSSYDDTSCVVKLEAGESVRPVVKNVSSWFYVNKTDNPDYMNIFFGYFLKTL